MIEETSTPTNALAFRTMGEVVLWFLFCVVLSRFGRLSCGGVVFTSLAIDEFSEWLATVSKLRRGVLGSRARSELNECWQMRSRLMGERSGRANSVQNRMCGRGGVAGDVTVTSGRICKVSTGRRSLQSRESGLQALRRRVGKKTEKLGVWKLRIRSSQRGLMPWRRRKECTPVYHVCTKPGVKTNRSHICLSDQSIVLGLRRTRVDKHCKSILDWLCESSRLLGTSDTLEIRTEADIIGVRTLRVQMLPIMILSNTMASLLMKHGWSTLRRNGTVRRRQ